MTRAPDDWLRVAKMDADRRGLPALKPLLTALADATRVLREASWTHDALGSPSTSDDPESTQSRDEPR